MASTESGNEYTVSATALHIENPALPKTVLFDIKAYSLAQAALESYQTLTEAGYFNIEVTKVFKIMYRQ